MRRKVKRRLVHLRKWRRAPLRMLFANVSALFWFLMDWVTAQWIPALIVIILGMFFWMAAVRMNAITPRSESPIWDEQIEQRRP